MIPFNIPPFVCSELEYIKQAVGNRKICGDGEFTKKCSEWLQYKTNAKKVLLTTSCTHALEMAAMLCDIKEGDEVIMPSYTFVSTANAFVLRGARVVFVDIKPETMNIDENLIKAAITPKTVAICVVHYAGVACEMDTIMDIAKQSGLFVVEDAAQAIMSTYKGRALGSIGDFGCFSFHETKNYSCGEGGALLINDEKYIDRAEIIREKGTNRSKFWRGEVDKYTWQDLGSSYLPSELNAAYLYAQLEQADKVNSARLQSYNSYYSQLKPLAKKKLIALPFIPKDCEHNGHMFYLKCSDINERANLIQHLNQNNIYSVFHYIPLHSSPAGEKYGSLCGKDEFTTKESERILRLPMYYELSQSNIDKICKAVKEFYEQ